MISGIVRPPLSSVFYSSLPANYLGSQLAKCLSGPRSLRTMADTTIAKDQNPGQQVCPTGPRIAGHGQRGMMLELPLVANNAFIFTD
jgi:hypothetical protein